jgi:2,3-bisphosphoglycerate-dependent phosphoglycerate mutase
VPSKLAIATLVFVSMRVLAVLSLGFTKGKLDKAEAQDAYILLVNSNFFLWAALFIGANAIAPDVMYGINDNAAQQL